MIDWGSEHLDLSEHAARIRGSCSCPGRDLDAERVGFGK